MDRAACESFALGEHSGFIRASLKNCKLSTIKLDQDLEIENEDSSTCSTALSSDNHNYTPTGRNKLTLAKGIPTGERPNSHQKRQQKLVENFVACNTIVLSPFAVYLVAHLAFLTWLTFALASFPQYGYAALPVGIVSFVGLANVSEICKPALASPKARWFVATLVELAAHCLFRKEILEPLQASRGNIWALLLIILSSVASAFYACFTIGCSIQCSMKQHTLPSPQELKDALINFKNKITR